MTGTTLTPRNRLLLYRYYMPPCCLGRFRDGGGDGAPKPSKEGKSGSGKKGKKKTTENGERKKSKVWYVMGGEILVAQGYVCFFFWALRVAACFPWRFRAAGRAHSHVWCFSRLSTTDRAGATRRPGVRAHPTRQLRRPSTFRSRTDDCTSSVPVLFVATNFDSRSCFFPFKPARYAASNATLTAVSPRKDSLVVTFAASSVRTNQPTLHSHSPTSPSFHLPTAPPSSRKRCMVKWSND